MDGGKNAGSQREEKKRKKDERKIIRDVKEKGSRARERERDMKV